MDSNDQEPSLAIDLSCLTSDDLDRGDAIAVRDEDDDDDNDPWTEFVGDGHEDVAYQQQQRQP